MRPDRGAVQWRTLAGVVAVVLVAVMTLGRAGFWSGGTSGSPGILNPDPPPQGYLEATRFPDDAGRDGRDVVLGPGVTLEAGRDGTLPVRPRWAVQLWVPETIAVDGDRLYAADEYLDAFGLSDGQLQWSSGNPEAPDEGLTADGGVYIALDGPDTVRAVAPYNYDISVDRETGEVRRFSYTTVPGADRLRPLPAPRPLRYRVGHRPFGMTGRTPSGAVAWTLRVDDPMYENFPSIAIPHGVVLLTSSGLLVVLDYV